MRACSVLWWVLVSGCFQPTPCTKDAECGGPGGACDLSWGFCLTTNETGDAGASDAGASDAGSTDAGLIDAGLIDAGLLDAGVIDAGVIDAGVIDAGVIDAGVIDAGVIDAGVPDAGPPPTVIATGPLALATNIAPDALLTATFSRPMAAPSLASSFTLAQGTPVAGAVALDGAMTSATFTPTAPLETNTVYTATVTTAATALDGPALSQDHTWRFTTALLWLRSAQTCSVLGASVTNTGSTTLSGGLGVTTSAPVMGGATLTVGGASHLFDAAAAEAKADLWVAYTAATALTPTASLATLDGRTLTAGVYTSNAVALALNTTLTLDGQGNPDAVFIFLVDAALNTGATSSSVNLVRGARAGNVFWQVSGAVTLGAGSSFKGTVLGLSAITVGAGATVQGRVLTLNGVVTLAGNGISN